MKKIALLISLFLVFSGEVYAQDELKSDLYFGLDVFSGQSDYERDYRGWRPASRQGFDKDLDQDGFRLKFGAVLDEGWRLQGYLQSEDMQEMDNNILSLGVDIIKSFEATPKFHPFILGGVGVSWMELDDEYGLLYEEDYNSALLLKFGLGAMYEITEAVEIVGGFDLQFRSWADMDVIEVDGASVYAYTMEQDDISKTFYLGLNIHF